MTSIWRLLAVWLVSSGPSMGISLDDRVASRQQREVELSFCRRTKSHAILGEGRGGVNPDRHGRAEGVAMHRRDLKTVWASWAISAVDPCGGAWGSTSRP